MYFAISTLLVHELVWWRGCAFVLMAIVPACQVVFEDSDQYDDHSSADQEDSADEYDSSERSTKRKRSTGSASDVEGKQHQTPSVNANPDEEADEPLGRFFCHRGLILDAQPCPTPDPRPSRPKRHSLPARPPSSSTSASSKRRSIGSAASSLSTSGGAATKKRKRSDTLQSSSSSPKRSKTTIATT
jgi:hypothetical protein